MFVRTQAIVTSSRFKQVRIKQFIIALAISVFASFCMAANTHAAGTANIKDVFGAAGNGQTDDSTAIQAAFDSDYDTLIFPEGDYLFTRQLTFATGNKTIIGEKATLFTNDTYNSPGGTAQNEWAILIRNVSNITFKGLTIETYQTNTPRIFATLVGVITASQIHFDSCRFFASSLTDQMVTSVDFYTGWHDVSITNSVIDLRNYHAENAGGGVYFRDACETGISNHACGTGVSNATFTNNTAYKRDRDELVWISASQANSSIDNVEVSGNRLYFGDPVLSYNVYTITARANVPDCITNLRIHNNEIIGQGSGPVIILMGTVNADITNNDISNRNSSPTDSTYSNIFSSRRAMGGGSTTNVMANIHHNRTITHDSAVNSGGIATTDAPVGNDANAFNITDNPHITINAPSSKYLVDHRGSFTNNNVTVNGNIYHNSGSTVISTNTRNVQNNHIHINGSAQTFFRNINSNTTLTGPATYTGNTITSTKKHTVGGVVTSARLIQMWSFSMNNHQMTISGNTLINGSEVEEDESLEAFVVADAGSNIITDRTPSTPYSLLWGMQLNDATPASQTVNICNNTLKGFRTKYSGAGYPTINLTCN